MERKTRSRRVKGELHMNPSIRTAGARPAPLPPMPCPTEGAAPLPLQGWSYAASSPPRPRKPFSASWQEVVAAFATYVLAWWYLWEACCFSGVWEEELPGSGPWCSPWAS